MAKITWNSVGNFVGGLIRWFFYLLGATVLIILLLTVFLGKSVRLDQGRVQWQKTNPVPTQPASGVDKDCPVCEVCDVCPENENQGQNPSSFSADTVDFDLVEISTGIDPLVGINNPKAVPTATLNFGQGIMLSSDAGSFVVQEFDTPSKTGFMAYVLNSSGKPVEVKVKTGFNDDNGRFNTSAVLFEVKNLKGLREKTLLQNCNENKPEVFGFVWNGSALVADSDLGNLTKMCNAQVKISRSEVQDLWVEYPELVELGTDITLSEIGINNPDKSPSVILKPGQGLWVSSDSGSYKVGDSDSIPVDKGYTIWVLNDSDKDLNLEFTTGFNTSQTPNRWNASFVVFSEATTKSLLEYAVQKNKDEVKPENFAFIWDGQKLSSNK